MWGEKRAKRFTEKNKLSPPTSSPHMLQGFRRRLPHPTRIVSGPIRKLCRHRASKRWSVLLTQTRSRIGHHFGMRARLGEANWEAFVRYAVTHHKAAFLLALLPANGVVCCAGKIDGTPCPHAATLALTNLADVTQSIPSALARLLKRFNGKPVLTRPEHTFYREPTNRWLTVDVDGHQYMYTTRSALALGIRSLRELVLGYGLLVEARAEQEMPEVMASSCMLLRLDPDRCQPFPPER